MIPRRPRQRICLHDDGSLAGLAVSPILNGLAGATSLRAAFVLDAGDGALAIGGRG